MEDNREELSDKIPNDTPEEIISEGESVADDPEQSGKAASSSEDSGDVPPSESSETTDEAVEESCDSEQSAQEGDDNPHEVIAKLGDDLALARADLFNLRKEYTNYVRRSKEAMSEHRERGHREVLEALIAVLDDIYAAREAGDLAEGPFAAIADKLENILSTNYDFARYGQQGEDFDPNLHDALMANESDDVDVATIAQVLQPGYKKGDVVVRATKVIVDNPT